MQLTQNTEHQYIVDVEMQVRVSLKREDMLFSKNITCFHKYNENFQFQDAWEISTWHKKNGP